MSKVCILDSTSGEVLIITNVEMKEFKEWIGDSNIWMQMKEDDVLYVDWKEFKAGGYTHEKRKKDQE